MIQFKDDDTPDMGNIKAEDAGQAVAPLPSDYRRKENIIPLGKGLKEINLLKPVSFNYKYIKDVSKKRATTEGFIAHEVQDIVPEAISPATIVPEAI